LWRENEAVTQTTSSIRIHLQRAEQAPLVDLRIYRAPRKGAAFCPDGYHLAQIIKQDCPSTPLQSAESVVYSKPVNNPGLIFCYQDIHAFTLNENKCPSGFVRCKHSVCANQLEPCPMTSLIIEDFSIQVNRDDENLPPINNVIVIENMCEKMLKNSNPAYIQTYADRGHLRIPEVNIMKVGEYSLVFERSEIMTNTPLCNGKHTIQDLQNFIRVTDSREHNLKVRSALIIGIGLMICCVISIIFARNYYQTMYMQSNDVFLAIGAFTFVQLPLKCCAQFIGKHKAVSFMAFAYGVYLMRSCVYMLTLVKENLEVLSSVVALRNSGCLSAQLTENYLDERSLHDFKIYLYGLHLLPGAVLMIGVIFIIYIVVQIVRGRRNRGSQNRNQDEALNDRDQRGSFSIPLIPYMNRRFGNGNQRQNEGQPQRA
jgi:hypothetical protein